MAQIFINILISFVSILLLAYSFSIIYSLLRFFHFAHAVYIALGAYITYSMTIAWDFQLWISVLFSVFICVLVMLAIYKCLFKPMQENMAEGWQMMIVSLGTYVVLQNIVSLLWGDNTLSIRTWDLRVGYEFFGAYVTDVQIATILADLCLFCICILVRKKSNIGKQIKTVSINPKMSEILGISKNKTVKWSICIGTGLASFSGIMIAADTNMSPTMGFNWLLSAIVAMIIGGLGKIRHLISGALLLAFTQNFVAYYMDSKWMNTVTYIFLIVFLAFRPSGFSGRQIKKSSL